MSVVYFLLGIVIGGILVYFWSKNQTSAVSQKLSSDLAVAKSQLEMARKNTEERVLAEQEYSKKMLEELRKDMETNKKLMQEEMRTMIAKMLDDSKTQLNDADKERLDALLKPLHERIEAFNQSVTAAAKEGSSNKTEIKTTFAETIKLLQEVQNQTVKTIREDNERAIKALNEQTERIGNDATSLTQALKGNSKMQGDWGEMILETTLESCGLVKNEQFFLQKSFQDTKGNTFRPDAVIDLPGGEHAVIDAKVSLIAYHSAVNATDSDEQKRFLQEHSKSIRKHVDELSAKHYEKIVPKCIGYVLMFVPYESGYSAAIKADKDILQYAYAKKVIMLSPSNLLMALQLTTTMWQNYRVNKNVEEIRNIANGLYEKFATFCEQFIEIGKRIEKLQSEYTKANNQLQEGKGNMVRRFEQMKELGLNPKKQIPEPMTEILEK